MNRLLLFSSLVVCLLLTSCSPSSDLRDDRGDSPPAPPPDAPPPRADRVEIVRGVPARGRDPGVVAIDIGGQALCSGSLVAPKLVLTARHCVSKTVAAVSCPPTGVQITGEERPSSLGIMVGDDIATARTVAHGVEVLKPSGVTLCDADIAFIVLDEEVKAVKPMPIGTRAPAKGDHVRAVGYGQNEDDGVAGKKLVREHVRVQAVTAGELEIGEATCHGDSGGPAIDETTGEIVGVLSRGGPTCEGSNVHNIYTRVDAFAWLVEEAFTRAAEEKAAENDAGLGSVRPGTKEKPATDVGAPCEKADDCGAGVCLTDGDTQYCSRECGTGDRCPTGYHCEDVEPSGKACVKAP